MAMEAEKCLFRARRAGRSKPGWGRYVAALLSVLWLFSACQRGAPPEFLRTPTTMPVGIAMFRSSDTSLSFIPAELRPVPPQGDAAAYRLRAWAENDSTVLLQRFYGVHLPPEYVRFSSGSYLAYLHTFQYERLLLFPNSPQWEAWAWEAAALAPSGVPLRLTLPDQDIFAVLFEDLLYLLDGNFSAARTWVKNHGFTVSVPSSVTGLFGDGQKALVFLAHDNITGVSAVYAVSPRGGHVRVERVMDWQSAGDDDYRIQGMRDTNANGLPEVIVAANGDARYGMICGQDLLLFEWQDGTFVSRGERLEIFRYPDYEGSCNGTWTFGVSAAGVPFLVTTAYRYTARDCPDFDVQRTYLWDGTQYRLKEETIPDYDSSEPACQLNWALKVIGGWPQGWNDDRTLGVVAGLLNDWPPSLDVVQGPASRDYFRLRLGMWHDLRGESEQALALLQPLAEIPYLARYDLPSRMAAAYLTGREAAGLLGACLHMDAAWKASQPARGFFKMIDEYGFIQNSELYYGLCSSTESLQAVPISAALEQGAGLQAWLERAGIRVWDTVAVDLNQDNKL